MPKNTNTESDHSPLSKLPTCLQRFLFLRGVYILRDILSLHTFPENLPNTAGMVESEHIKNIYFQKLPSMQNNTDQTPPRKSLLLAHSQWLLSHHPMEFYLVCSQSTT